MTRTSKSIVVLTLWILGIAAVAAAASGCTATTPFTSAGLKTKTEALGTAALASMASGSPAPLAAAGASWLAYAVGLAGTSLGIVKTAQQVKRNKAWTPAQRAAYREAQQKKAAAAGAAAVAAASAAAPTNPPATVDNPLPSISGPSAGSGAVAGTVQTPQLAAAA
jgi:hypothetical protein